MTRKKRGKRKEEGEQQSSPPPSLPFLVPSSFWKQEESKASSFLSSSSFSREKEEDEASLSLVWLSLRGSASPSLRSLDAGTHTARNQLGSLASKIAPSSPPSDHPPQTQPGPSARPTGVLPLDSTSRLPAAPGASVIGGGSHRQDGPPSEGSGTDGGPTEAVNSEVRIEHYISRNNLAVALIQRLIFNVCPHSGLLLCRRLFAEESSISPSLAVFPWTDPPKDFFSSATKERAGKRRKGKGRKGRKTF